MSAVMVYNVLRDLFFFNGEGKIVSFSLLVTQRTELISCVGSLAGPLHQHSVSGENKLWTN